MLQRALQCVMTAKLPRTLAVPPPASISCRGHAGILPRQPTINSSDGADARTSGLHPEAAADPRSIELLVDPTQLPDLLSSKARSIKITGATSAFRALAPRATMAPARVRSAWRYDGREPAEREGRDIGTGAA